MFYITKNFQETINLGINTGKQILSSPEKINLICLYGDLGSGKTTFVQGLAKGLGIIKPTPSPTFIIVRQYKINSDKYNNLFHVDLYRLDKNMDIQSLGLEEILSDPFNLVVIEWAERLKSQIPEKRMNIKIAITDHNQRKIEYE